MLLLKKINKYSEITPDDCKSKRLWLLQCDGHRYFFNNPNGEFTKDLYNKFKDSVYRYSPAEFDFECSFDDLSHEDSPDAISGTFSVSAKLFPGGVGFASWIAANKIDELTVADVKAYFQKPENSSILRKFIQQLMTERSLGELLNAQGDVIKFHSSNSLTWLVISAVRTIRMSQNISDVQRRINAYNAWSSEQEEKLQYAQQQLEYEISWANIEAAKEEIAKRAELAEQAHTHNLENAEREQEIKRLQSQLEQKRLQALSEVEAEEIKHKIEKMRLEQEAYKADIALTENRIKQQNAQIKLTDIMSAKAAIDFETAGIEKKKAEKELNILNLAEERSSAEKQKFQELIDQGEKNLSDMKAAISLGNTSVVEEIKQEIAEQTQDFDQKLEQISREFLERMNAVMHFQTSAAPPSLTHIVREQRKNSKVYLNKEAAIQQDAFIQSRNVNLPVKLSTVQIGSAMKFSFQSSVAGFITIICFGTSGQVQLLEPNFIDGYPEIEADRRYSFPGTEFLSDYKGLRQDGPVGTEELLIIVSQSSLKDFFYEQEDLESFDTVTQDQLSLLAQKLSSLPRHSWAAGYLSYKVTEAKKQ